MEMIIALISAVIAFVSAATSIYYNSKNQKQYNKSIEPALSFKLFRHESLLYLQITNTGQSPAIDIRIEIKAIRNNGNRNELKLDKLFGSDFDLYPTEVTQGMVAIWGENIAEHVFPSIDIYVEYVDKITQKETVLTRTIIFNPSFRETVYATVNMDLNKISSSIDTIAKANLRTANYLDGYQLSSIDELDILSGRSLHDDMVDIKEGKRESSVVNRQQLFRELTQGSK